MAQLSLSLLGPFQVLLDNEPVTDFSTDKVRALLVYLAVESDRPHRRDTLAGLLWPDQPQHKARQNLRQALSYLRRTLGERSDVENKKNVTNPFLLVTRQTVQFNAASDHWLDVAVFKTLVNDSTTHRHSRPKTCLPCTRRMKQMAALYRGDFLDQFFLSDSALFEEWAMLEREKLHRQAIDGLSHLINHYERRGNHAQARQYAWQQVELETWREEAHRHLMRLLALDGERSAALAQYETCRRALAEELSVEPTNETVTLYKRIRAGEKFQPLAPLHNIPPSPTSFVGRKAELEELTDLLADPDCRLVTLVGPGGIGKTRLALQVAADHVGAFAHGVYFVPLGPVSSTEFLLPALSNALHFSFQSQQDIKEQLLNYLREKELLLVLDSLEHVLEVSEFLVEILRHSPSVVLLTTSRERLNLQEEWVYEIEGLTYPNGKITSESETYTAMDLFQQRASQANRRFMLSKDQAPYAAIICQLVTGTPLGIELAAAGVAVRSCQEIAREIERNLDILTTRLRNVPQRHQSIRATFEHSWNLLSQEEQIIFTKLSVFRGGFRRKAAEQIVDASLPTLSALVDKSLLRYNSLGRYQIHELLRQYAAEKLETQTRIEALHSSYYATFLQEQERALKGKNQQKASQAINAEIDNVRSAWRWAFTQLADQQDKKLALTIIKQSLKSLYLFYTIQDRYQEGEQVFEQAATALSNRTIAGKEELVLGQLLAHQGKCCEFTTHSDKAKRLFERSLAIFNRLDAWRETALPLFGLGYMAHMKGEYAQATQYFQNSLAIYQKMENRWGIATVLSNLCLVARRQGAFLKAKEQCQESLSIRREIGDQKGIASSLNNLGLIYCAVGEYVEAKDVLHEALEICRQLDYKTGIANAFTCLCQAAFNLGQVEAAEQFSYGSLEIYQDIGDRWGVAIAYNNLGHIAMELGNSIQAQHLYQESIAVYRQIDIRSGLANTLGNLGEVCYDLGKYAQARQYLYEALQIAHEIHALPIVLDTLVGLAPLLEQEGKTIKSLKMLAFAIQQPTILQAVKEKASTLFSEMTTHISPEIVTMTKAESQTYDLDTLVAEILRDASNIIWDANEQP
ncbi:MAG: tetratricopeptide repeat protein [Chloroflexi bacterium]|nr:tetratricopeptide repeat protein [Chloroflexota bacterium]